MRCASCGTENPERARFCMTCGVAIAASCRECGAEMPAGARFCIECGTAAAAPSAQPDGGAGDERLSPLARAAGAAAARDPRAYTPRHLVEKILSHRSAIEGERKQVTVLL